MTFAVVFPRLLIKLTSTTASPAPTFFGITLLIHQWGIEMEKGGRSKTTSESLTSLNRYSGCKTNQGSGLYSLL